MSCDNTGRRPVLRGCLGGVGKGEAAFFIVKGVTDQELGLLAITVCWEVRGLKAVPQEEVVTPVPDKKVALLFRELCWMHYSMLGGSA